MATATIAVKGSASDEFPADFAIAHFTHSSPRRPDPKLSPGVTPPSLNCASPPLAPETACAR
jgi:hypothetical protein